MPKLLEDGLPERVSRSKFDLTRWVDGQAWEFVKGEDYQSSTETFRGNVKSWAKQRGLQVELRSIPARDGDGKPLPLTKADPLGLAIRFAVDGVAPAA
jgi:hypothetical protein